MRRCSVLVLSVPCWLRRWRHLADPRTQTTGRHAKPRRAILRSAPAVARSPSKKYRGSVLSILYTNRGAEFGAKGELDRAMKDHDQALKLDPKNALAFNNRGIAKLKKGDKESGEADIAKAKQLQPGIGEPQCVPDDGARKRKLNRLMVPNRPNSAASHFLM